MKSLLGKIFSPVIITLYHCFLIIMKFSFESGVIIHLFAEDFNEQSYIWQIDTYLRFIERGSYVNEGHLLIK